jgi:hypothetical protein
MSSRLSFLSKTSPVVKSSFFQLQRTKQLTGVSVGTLSSTKLSSANLIKTEQRQGQGLFSIQESGIKQDVKPIQDIDSIQLQKQGQKSLVATSQISVSITTPNFYSSGGMTSLVTPVPLIFKFPTSKIGKSLKSTVTTKQSRRYTPSLTSGLFNIKGKPSSADIKGLGIRPIPTR